jgi:hypothetical protein
MTTDPLSLLLTLCSGLFWTLVYLEGIRVGVRDRSYAIPFWALALNLAWEVVNTIHGALAAGIAVQVVINAVWAVFDLGILATYFRYGRKDFPSVLPAGWFLPWSLLALFTAFVVEEGFILWFGLYDGRAYAAFLQNLLMSVLFLVMLAQRGGPQGQSVTIALCKWLGTLAPTLLFGVVGAEGMNGPNPFILALGLLCSLFDLLYLAVLWRVRRVGKAGLR